MELNIIHLFHRKDREELLLQELNEQDIAHYKIWEGHRDIEKPKKGIATAHKNIVRSANERNLDSVIIAEDDIKFTSRGAFRHFVQMEPIEFDLYLGGIFYGKIDDNNRTSDFAGLTLYIIRQKFYDTFLSLPENRDIDRALAYKGDFYVCNPFVVTQHNGFSDNINATRNYEPYLRNRSLF